MDELGIASQILGEPVQLIKAQTVAVEALANAQREKPDFSMAFIENTLPAKYPGGIDPYLEGLRKAGLT